ncbi:MAG TPA: EMC3/TMCO1 family protein [Candidatus Nanoarchaeia archaeon]|nr:EMC3/TMCO1 family protein [Candidatus Nanoarchaeia archaeon]
MGFYETVFSPVFGPMLRLGPFWAIFIISLVLAFLTTIIHKYATDQKRMKELREEMKEHQRLMKENKHDISKVSELQKETMKRSMEQMKHSFKAMIYTFIPLILIFGWMNIYLSYEPVMVGEEVTLTANFLEGMAGEAGLASVPAEGLTFEKTAMIEAGKAVWRIKAEKEGNYLLNVGYKDKTFSRELLITSEFKYSPQLQEFKEKGSEVKSLALGYNKLRPLNGVPWIGGLSWFWLYVLLSIGFSALLRKVMKVY